MLPTKIKVDANPKIMPAKKVSTVSCQYNSQFAPLFSMNGTDVSFTNLSTAHDSDRAQSDPSAINGLSRTKLSSPVTDIAAD